MIVAEPTHFNAPSNLVLDLLYPAPAITIDPIREIPKMAFVADISSVCNKGGTREMR
jgi:hypothetical protein